MAGTRSAAGPCGAQDLGREPGQGGHPSYLGPVEPLEKRRMCAGRRQEEDGGQWGEVGRAGGLAQSLGRLTN